MDYHEGGNVGHLRGELPGAFAMKPFQIFAQRGPDGEPKSFTTRPDPRALKWPPGVYEYTCTAEQWLKAWRVKGWNSARVLCVGKYPRVFEILGREGSIGLQIHGGKAMWPTGKVCRWRNISIQRL